MGARRVLSTRCFPMAVPSTAHRLHWSPLEKLAGSIGAGLLLIYLLQWTLFVLRVDSGGQQIAVAATIAVCAATVVWKWRPLLAFFRIAPVRQIALGYLFLVGWALLLLTMI